MSIVLMCAVVVGSEVRTGSRLPLDVGDWGQERGKEVIDGRRRQSEFVRGLRAVFALKGTSSNPLAVKRRSRKNSAMLRLVVLTALLALLATTAYGRHTPIPFAHRAGVLGGMELSPSWSRRRSPPPSLTSARGGSSSTEAEEDDADNEGSVTTADIEDRDSAVEACDESGEKNEQRGENVGDDDDEEVRRAAMPACPGVFDGEA